MASTTSALPMAAAQPLTRATQKRVSSSEAFINGGSKEKTQQNVSNQSCCCFVNQGEGSHRVDGGCGGDVLGDSRSGSSSRWGYPISEELLA
ncbi:hypothetical protein V6N12_056898 [Hibiscus sabdariffa]|uniref:Uncharacterized protein n=1 Tax=Hibiscus sabdariffa TaxID=183260 RepID=A0ABR2DCG8_9ROSI